MKESILFYVSGHGFGHARRMTQVIRSLHARNPNIQIHVRSAAPARIFEPLAPECVEHCEIDAGLTEIDPLTIDRPGSLCRLETFMARREPIVAEEISAVRRLKPRLIVADIPFLAGNVAHHTGVPCLGISNFTWDWIYENLFGDDPRYAELAPAIADGYAKMSGLLELPLGRTCPAFVRKTPVPLLAMKSNRDADEVLAQLGVSAADKRPRVLFGTRGRLSANTFARAAADAAEFLFLCPHERSESLPDNAISFALSPALDFSDVTLVADIVISKLGYGIVSECIATQTRLVWPRRFGFIEDEIVAAEAPEYVPMLEIPRDDYLAGRWGESLRKAIMLDPSARTMPTDGADVCSRLIERFALTPSQSDRSPENR